MTPVITLLTDFGIRDPYAGIMKGIIAGICPEATVIDLTHAVQPQDVEDGAYQLARAARWFPPGTIHVAVVDPGVGSHRRAVVVRGERHLYVAPDNGLLTLVLRQDPVEVIHQVQPGRYTLGEISSTFQGRDVFAPVAAHLARGLAPAELGPQLDALEWLEFPASHPVEEGYGTWVAAVDHFGNLITPVRPAELGFVPTRARVAGRWIPIVSHYAAVPRGELAALWGSDGTLEISVHGGSAAQVLRVGRRERVLVSP